MVSREARLDVLRGAPTSVNHLAVTSPEDIPRAFVQSWNERDAEGIASIFEADADFVNVTGIWWEDRASIERAHAWGFEKIFGDSRLRLGRVKVRPLGDDVAIVHARVTLEGQTPVGAVGDPGRRVTIFSFVARLRSGAWRCVSAHNTDVVAGAETHARQEDGSLLPVDYRGGPGSPDARSTPG
ncbi:SgcJ/EcaC family oxidoreductase [soil metagenome]